MTILDRIKNVVFKYKKVNITKIYEELPEYSKEVLRATINRYVKKEDSDFKRAERSFYEVVDNKIENEDSSLDEEVEVVHVSLDIDCWDEVFEPLMKKPRFKNEFLNRLNKNNMSSLLDEVKIKIYTIGYKSQYCIKNNNYVDGIIELTLGEYLDTFLEKKDFSEYEKCHHWYGIYYDLKNEDIEKRYRIDYNDYEDPYDMDAEVSIDYVISDINIFLNSERLFSKAEQILKEHNLMVYYLKDRYDDLLDNISIEIYTEDKYNPEVPIKNDKYADGNIILSMRDYLNTLSENRDFTEYEKCHHMYGISYNFIDNSVKTNYCLVYEDYDCLDASLSDYTPIEVVIGDINRYLKSEVFYFKVDEICKKHNLIIDYSQKELWKDNSKEYKDEEYVSITRIKDDTEWGFNDLYDYLKENKSEEIYKIFNMRKNADVMYISKDNLSKILNDRDTAEEIKKDIENVLDREVNCCICNNTTYINTHAYVYDDFGGCVGRFYACPICLDLYDLRISPDSDYTKNLNGSEKMDLLNYMNERKKEFI